MRVHSYATCHYFANAKHRAPLLLPPAAEVGGYAAAEGIACISCRREWLSRNASALQTSEERARAAQQGAAVTGYMERSSVPPDLLTEAGLREWMAWAWEPLFPDRSAELRAGAVPGAGEQEAMLGWLQGGRCATCPVRHSLVLDHDHSTGLSRGLLCHGCNRREGTGGSSFAAYRSAPPAAGFGWIYEDWLGDRAKPDQYVEEGQRFGRHAQDFIDTGD